MDSDQDDIVRLPKSDFDDLVRDNERLGELVCELILICDLSDTMNNTLKALKSDVMYKTSFAKARRLMGRWCRTCGHNEISHAPVCVMGVDQSLSTGPECCACKRFIPIPELK